MSKIEIPDTPLPTLDRLGISADALPAISAFSALSVARTWLSSVESAASSSTGNVDEVLALLHPSEPFWRDFLALTWNLRTFSGPSKIRAFLASCLPKVELHDLVVNETYTQFQQPYPDLAWISAMFDFKTKVGGGTGIVRLVPFPKPKTNKGSLTLDDLEWKAHTVFTNLESLTGYPEAIGPNRSFEPNHGKWESQREAAASFVGAEEDPSKGPKVLVIGAGQSGLDVAARLKALDVSTLIIERNARVGDNWRERYDALCLHDPVWYDHMPYLPFPPTWPAYTPAKKLGNWLEFYADALELNIWTSSTIKSLTHDPNTKKWHVTILRQRLPGQVKAVTGERTFIVNHVVFCTGLGSATPNMPVYPGMNDGAFKGAIMHSSQFHKAEDHAGKKIVVVGACTSAHDIAEDCYKNGLDVTMIQRGSTYIMSVSNGWDVLFKASYSEISPLPTHVADLATASFPHHMALGLNQRSTSLIAKMDKELLDGLHKVGFRTNLGVKGTGFGILAWGRAGGYYLDTGASGLIAEGKIKLKNDGQISHFVDKKVVFENGTELDADVVVFATGLGDPTTRILSTPGISSDPSFTSKLKPLWGLDAEGELQGAWKDMGVPGLWYMMGNLALCRFYSKHVALQIKAMEEEIFGDRYVD